MKQSTDNWGAWIGAVATIASALISGVFLLYSQQSSDVSNTIDRPPVSSFRQPDDKVVTPTNTSLPITQSTSLLPYPICLLIGEWEAQVSNNNFQLKIEWNPLDRQFEGRLIKQTATAKAGELVYAAKITDEGGILSESSRWTSAGWRENVVDINKWVAADTGTFYNGLTFFRQNQSRLDSCRA